MEIAIINGAKALIVPFDGENYLFLFNGQAMIWLDEQGGSNAMFERFGQKGKAGIDAVGEVCRILSEQAQAARQYAGISAGTVFDIDLHQPTVTPAKIIYLRTMAVEAINLGYGREVKDDDEEVDLVLAELEKKNQV